MSVEHPKMLMLTYQQGSSLLQACYNLAIPSKIGTNLSFSEDKQASIARHVRHLKKILVDLSPIMKEERLTHFGPRENYEQILRRLTPDQNEVEAGATGEVSKIRYELKNKLATVAVELTGSAWKGLYHVLLLWIHPGPCWVGGKEVIYTLPPGRQDDFAWDIARQAGMVRQLEKECLLDQSTDHAIKSDAEFEEEAARAAKEKAEEEAKKK
jgi:hypothetical protein